MDLSEFEASLVYKASFRTGKTVTWRNPVFAFQVLALKPGGGGTHL